MRTPAFTFEISRVHFCLLALLVSLCRAWSNEEVQPEGRKLLIERLEPTALILNTSPLRQVVILHVTNSTSQNIECETSFELDESTVSWRERFVASPGHSEHRLSIPDISSTKHLTLEIKDSRSNDVLARHEQGWLPQRHWKIFLIESSHEDLGYENYIYVKQAEIADQIEAAAALSDLRSPGELSSYTYTMETLLFMRNYIEERSAAAWRALVESHVKTGRLHLAGAPSGVHTHWMDYEELARMTYGRREVMDRFGLDLNTYLMVDNPSVSWSAAQAIADSGFKYIARFGQRWRAGTNNFYESAGIPPIDRLRQRWQTGNNNDYESTGVPPIFWWIGPDTKSRILFAWRGQYFQPLWYGQDVWRYTGIEGDPSLELSSRLKQIESGKLLGPYPYDALLNPDYSDHKPPVFDAEALTKWHAQYRYPEIRLTSPTSFFEYIEESFPEKIPTLSGDLNNFSADYAAIDPESQGYKRRAARLLPLGEGLAAISTLFQPDLGASGRSFDRAYLRLLDYDEHSWPTKPRPSDYHAFNSQWVKVNEGKRALDHANELVNAGFDSLLRQIPNPEGTKVVVFNPLAHVRTDVVQTEISNVDIFDLVTGKSIPGQSIEGGRTLFQAADVPAFGYKVYGARPRQSPETPSKSLKAGERSIENQFYRIQFSPVSGSITSIWDKEIQRELVSLDFGYEFNQLVYIHKNDSESKEGFEHSPKAAVLSPGKVGAVKVTFSATIDDEVTGANIIQDVSLYDNSKRIDIENRLSHVNVLFSSEWTNRYKDNIYYAFPLRSDPVEFHVEYPGGVVRPYEDQLRWGAHDFLYANRWINVGNQEFSATLAPWEAGTFNFGEIRYNQFAIDYKPIRPILFNYAYANRMAGLISQGPSECNVTLRYSFTSHAGNWRTGATTRFGWQVASPLEARVLSTVNEGRLPPIKTSFVGISAPNVQLVTLKQSEKPGQGWIVRLVETEGKDTQVSLSLPHFPFTSAWECNLIEDDVSPLPVTSNRVELLVGKNSYATVRVLTHQDKLPQVQNLRAAALSDKSIRITWDALDGPQVAYNVFRSDDPNEPPTIHSLIARTASSTFDDDGLKIDTDYYYLVAPVTMFNNQGVISDRLRTTTSKQNISPPGPVKELGIVRRASNVLIVYWRKNPELDTSKYHVYRSKSESFDTVSGPIATVDASRYFLQTFRDDGVSPDTVYYYKVVAEDTVGNRQTLSPITSARTPAILVETSQN